MFMNILGFLSSFLSPLIGQYRVLIYFFEIETIELQKLQKYQKIKETGIFFIITRLNLGIEIQSLNYCSN